MKYRRELLLLIPTIASIFFITDYNVFFGSNVQAQRQSQSTTSVCNSDSCFTTVCSNNQPCKTFSSNQPSIIQPAEATKQYTESTLEVCDDGLDNDNDGKVDNKDEECEATTFSSASPIQGQLMPDDQNEPEEDKPQSEQPSQEEEHTDNDSSNYDEEKEDKDEENN